MPFNRIRGFYIGSLAPLESKPMSIEEKNNALNETIKNSLDALNNIIQEHEKALRAMTILRDVSYTYKRWDIEDEQGNPTGHEEALLLGIRKWNGTWRLCHGYYNDVQGTEWKPLADSSVVDRLAAVPHIEKLQQAIVDDKEKLDHEVTETLGSAIESMMNYPGGTAFVESIFTGLQNNVQRKKKK